MTMYASLHREHVQLGDLQHNYEANYKNYARIIVDDDLSKLKEVEFPVCLDEEHTVLVRYFAIGDGRHIFYAGPVSPHIPVWKRITPKIVHIRIEIKDD